MGKVIKETIRLWGINFYDRTCTKDYYIPELKFTVPKGMHVTIAAGKIMTDEATFEDPLAFEPDQHFDSPNAGNFIGFGLGPRSCIGMRFAFTIVRTGLFHTLAKYKITRGPKTKANWNFSPIIPGGVSHDDIFVQIESRI